MPYQDEAMRDDRRDDIIRSANSPIISYVHTYIHTYITAIVDQLLRLNHGISLFVDFEIDVCCEHVAFIVLREQKNLANNESLQLYTCCRNKVLIGMYRQER